MHSSRLLSPMPLAALPLALVAGSFLCSSSAFGQARTNAPVAPDTIYVGRSGGLSIVDLNGFGASTGNPFYDPTAMHEGDSNYPNNPNVKYQGVLLRPPLAPGTSTLDGGSSGVFTLTRNSLLDDLLLKAPAVQSIADMMLGQPLDLVYSDGPAPFGCQAGGGNLCAILGLKAISLVFNGANTLAPSASLNPLQFLQGQGNPISFAPSPNPPPLLSVPLCSAPWLDGQEPTSVDTLSIGLSNLLAPGDPFGNPLLNIPPTGLLAREQNGFFGGPSYQQTQIGACLVYSSRQQIGHFLYIADRTAGQVVVVNSNTLRVLARIPLTDPTEFAMSPGMKLLAVTQRSLDRVTFIDIDPASPNFHHVANTVQVGDEPVGIAWDPGDEDVLVCNQGSDSVSIISSVSLQVRKIVHRGLDRPFAIAVTQRQESWGFQRNVYYAYILDRSGHVSLYESGPNTVNGWGFDDIVGRTDFVFPRPKALQLDPLRVSGGVWVAHEVQLDAHGVPTTLLGGAVTNLVLEGGPNGVIPLNFNDVPNMRGLRFVIPRSIGDDQLTGVPVDLAFDDQRNLGALASTVSPFGGGTGILTNGKSPIRLINGAAFNTNEAAYMFLPVRHGQAGTETIDVIDLITGVRVDTNAFQTGKQSIPAPGAALVMDYFRQ